MPSRTLGSSVDSFFSVSSPSQVVFLDSLASLSGCCAVVDFFLVVAFIDFFAGVLTVTSGYFFFGSDGAIGDRVLLLVRRLRRFSLLAV